MPKTKLFSVTIDDCDVEALASTSGGGGQNRNRRHTAIRITHRASGAVGYSADERSQLQNKTVAFRRMTETKEFKAWHRRTTAELVSGKTIEQAVEEAMDPKNLKVEVRGKAGWEPLSGSISDADA